MNLYTTRKKFHNFKITGVDIRSELIRKAKKMYLIKLTLKKLTLIHRLNLLGNTILLSAQVLYQFLMI